MSGNGSEGQPGGGKVRKIARHIAAVLTGIAVHLVVFFLTEMVVSLLARLPIIGAILYWPSDTSWAMMVLPPSNGAFAGAFVARKIAGTATPACIAIAAIWALFGVSLLATIGFQWDVVIVAGVAIVSALICAGGEKKK